jgi:hypothetical protein
MDLMVSVIDVSNGILSVHICHANTYFATFGDTNVAAIHDSHLA